MPDAATAAAAPNPHLAQYAAKGLKGRILSGVQPTGNLHLGNYLGAIRNFARLQNDYECLYCVVDMHAITVWQDPAQMVPQSREIAAAFLAAGVDGRKQIIFNQSMVPEHAQLAWIFNCVARMGWMSRMTQFKDKAGKNREGASVGLYDYPVLMAADVPFTMSLRTIVLDDKLDVLPMLPRTALPVPKRYCSRHWSSPAEAWSVSLFQRSSCVHFIVILNSRISPTHSVMVRFPSGLVSSTVSDLRSAMKLGNSSTLRAIA